MDFFVNAIGDVFAWTFLISLALTGLLAVATLGTAAAAAAGALSIAAPLSAGGLTVAALLVSLLGLAGDYLQRIYRQSSGRPFYLVRRVHEVAVPEPALETPGARR
jgi:hypothetical protein